MKKRTGKVPAGLISIENVLSAPLPSPDGSPVPIPVGRSGEDFPFGFSTKYHDREVGLISYQLRSYSPTLGRWLSRDPIEEEGGVNLYVKTGNNETIDYIGLSSISGSTTFDVKCNGHWARVFDHYAPGSSLARQISVYKTVWLEDIYRLDVNYTKTCKTDNVADIRIGDVKGNLLGHLDRPGFALGAIGLGKEYSYSKNENSIPTNNGTHIVLEVTFIIKRSNYVGITPGIGPLSVDIGLNFSYNATVVGKGTLKLSHDCCK